MERKKLQGGANPAPTLENCIPWFEKHFQRYSLASGTASGVRAPAEILTMLLSPRPHTRPQHSHLLLVGWGKADTASPEHGAREDVFEKFLLRQGLSGELWHQMTRVPVLALLLPSCVTLNELPNHSGLSFPHL